MSDEKLLPSGGEVYHSTKWNGFAGNLAVDVLKFINPTFILYFAGGRLEYLITEVFSDTVSRQNKLAFSRQVGKNDLIISLIAIVID